MANVDMPLSELRTYRPDVFEPADFDAFWNRTLEEARQVAAQPTISRWEGPVSELDVFDVRFPGFGGEPIAGWLTMPRGLDAPTPCVVEYNGYGGGRGFPTERMGWATAGFVHFFMDSRGQASAWGSGGDTEDPHGTGPSSPGFMTRGIQSPDTYYYRRFFTDAARAVDFVKTLECVDTKRIAVAGGSQGGGTALAAGALADGVAAVMADVPFLCHFRRAVEMTEEFPYGEIIKYLSVHRHDVDDVFTTLGYFDGVNMARRITAPTLMSVGLRDLVCPPSTIFAAANHLPHEPELVVYPFNGHEGGGHFQWLRQLDWLSNLFGVSR